MNPVDCLPHRPPMRLVDEIVELTPGESATGRRTARADDFYFQGHFPGQPIVPAIVLIELMAQTGGIAVAAPPLNVMKTGTAQPLAPRQLRVAAVGPFKFPAAAGPDVDLQARVRVAGKIGGLFKIEGEVTADGVVVAAGSLTLAG